MKKLFTAGAILLTVTVFGQTTITAKNTVGIKSPASITFQTSNKPVATVAEFKVDSLLRIHIYPKGLPNTELKSGCFNFSFEGKDQLQRRNDTLTILEKTIRFIVIDGVTYEVVRSTEVKKVEEFPKARIYGYPGNIQLTPGISNVWGPVFKTN